MTEFLPKSFFVCNETLPYASLRTNINRIIFYGFYLSDLHITICNCGTFVSSISYFISYCSNTCSVIYVWFFIRFFKSNVCSIPCVLYRLPNLFTCTVHTIYTNAVIIIFARTPGGRSI